MVVCIIYFLSCFKDKRLRVCYIVNSKILDIIFVVCEYVFGYKIRNLLGKFQCRLMILFDFIEDLVQCKKVCILGYGSYNVGFVIKYLCNN